MLIGALHPTYRPALKQLNKPNTISEFTPFWKKKRETKKKWFIPPPEMLVDDKDLQGDLDEQARYRENVYKYLKCIKDYKGDPGGMTRVSFELIDFLTLSNIGRTSL